MTTAGWVSPVAVAAGVGSGLVGGVFFAFSGFVMPALRRLPGAEGVRAMQQINRTAVHPPLMIALFGTALASVAVAVPAVRALEQRWAQLTLAGSVLFLASDVAVTIAANVPLNDRLARVDPSTAGPVWTDYLSSWTAWNHARTVGGLAACLLYFLAYRQLNRR